jgi:hypothetical protein
VFSPTFSGREPCGRRLGEVTASLADADLVTFNAAREVTLPARERRLARVWSRAQVAAFLSHAERAQ